jgi:hypothetical protein
MVTLNLAPNVDDPDGFYAKLIDAHHGLCDKDSAVLNARLILLLANQIGDGTVLDEALKMASEFETQDRA